MGNLRCRVVILVVALLTMHLAPTAMALAYADGNICGRLLVAVANSLQWMTISPSGSKAVIHYEDREHIGEFPITVVDLVSQRKIKSWFTQDLVPNIRSGSVEVRSFVWDKSEKSFMYLGNGSIWRADIVTGAVDTIAKCSRCSAFTVAADGKAAIIREIEKGVYQLEVKPSLTSRAISYVVQRVSSGDISFAPNSRRIAYLVFDEYADKSIPYRIHVLDLNTSKTVRMPYTNLSALTWASNDEMILPDKDAPRLWKVDVRTGRQVAYTDVKLSRALQDTTIRLQHVQVSPNLARVIYRLRDRFGRGDVFVSDASCLQFMTVSRKGQSGMQAR